MPTRVLADQNCDGLVTAADFTSWQSNYTNGDLRADQNGDEVLSPADFTAWVANYGLGLEGPYGPAYGCDIGKPLSMYQVNGVLPQVWPQAVAVSGYSTDWSTFGAAGEIIDGVVLDAPLLGRLLVEDRYVIGDDVVSSPPAGQVDHIIIEYSIGAFTIQRQDLSLFYIVGLVEEYSLERRDDATGVLISSQGHVSDLIKPLGVYSSFSTATQDLLPYADMLDLEIENPYPGTNGHGDVILSLVPVGDVIYDFDTGIITDPDPLQVSCAQLHPGDCPAIVACTYDRKITACLSAYKSANAACIRRALGILGGGGLACAACWISPPTAPLCCVVRITIGTIAASTDAHYCGLRAIADKRACMADAKLDFDAQMAGCD